MPRNQFLVAAGVTLAGLGTVAWFGVQSPRVRLVIAAADGSRTIVGDLPGDTFSPRISPDGHQMSFQSRGDTWIADLRDLSAPRRFKPLSNVTFAVWQTPQRLLFISSQPSPSLYSAATDSDHADLLVDEARAPDGWSDAANGLSFITLKGDDYDIWFYSAATKRVTPLVVIPGTRQLSSQISPDGKWVAYKSDETGSFEIWVQPFPSGPRTQVTRTGGRNPRWAADSHTLYFDDDHQLFAVKMTGEAPAAFGTPQPLPIKGFIQAGSLRRQWDIMPDGRFLMMVR